MSNEKMVVAREPTIFAKPDLNGEPNDNHHRIDHNSAVPPKLLTRYSEIGIVPVVYGHCPTCFTDYGPPPEESRSWEWPWQALLDANPGLPVAWLGGDPWNGRVRPLYDRYSFVTRDGAGEDAAIFPATDWQKQHVIAVE